MSDELEHYGVPGMKWGHRKARTSSGRKSTTQTVKRTPEEEALRKQRIKVGKEVAKAVVIGAGTLAITAVAGPVVGAGAGAVARTLASHGKDLFPTTTTVTATTTRVDEK